jgi:hypothetical protein
LAEGQKSKRASGRFRSAASFVDGPLMAKRSVTSIIINISRHYHLTASPIFLWEAAGKRAGAFYAFPLSRGAAAP